MKTFIINGKEINAKPFNFNMICDLEDMGVKVEEASEKPLSMVRAYIGICLGMSKADAGAEIEQHVIGGGDFVEATEAMSYEMEHSDFFLALNKKNVKEIATAKTRKSAK